MDIADYIERPKFREIKYTEGGDIPERYDYMEPKMDGIWGCLVIDNGAHQALLVGKSLLPAGVLRATGGFDRGDAVSIVGYNGEMIGVGISAYSSADIDRIRGHKTSEIAAILSYAGREEVVHRKDLVLEREMTRKDTTEGESSAR